MVLAGHDLVQVQAGKITAEIPNKSVPSIGVEDM